LTSRSQKLIAFALIAVVVAGGLGYWLLAPRMPTETVSYTTQQASLSTTSEKTSLLTSSVQTQLTSTLSTSVTSETGLWINVTATKPVNYYLGLLESNRTEPYVQLAKELRKLPDATNATAIAKITYLALNATNPEVKEAFELIMKGGRPSQSDFTYVVPNYNTELQVLYWLAGSSQFKRDDTLALAIAMSNGFWVSVGDDQVRNAVKNDTSSLLSFFRATDALQESMEFFRLEDLPLEAKIALAWTGGDTGTHGPHAITGSQTKHDCKRVKLDLTGYRWDNVNVETLRQMRDHMKQKGWITKNIDQTVANVEEYFFFSGKPKHYKYVSSWDVKVQVDGETVSARNMNNANFNFRYYLEHGYAIGVCEDEMTLVSGFLKSWGVATLPQLSYWREGDSYNGHTYTMYFDAASKTWKCYPSQIGIVFYDVRDAYIFLPPIMQSTYMPWSEQIPRAAAVPYPYQSGEVNTAMLCPMLNITGSYLNAFIRGVASAQIKAWVLYGEKPAAITTTYTTWTQQGAWNVLPDGSLDLIGEDGKIAGDLRQPYVDLANVSYSFYNGSLFFRFSLHDKIPNKITTTRVTSIWYQVLLDVDSDSRTGFRWSNSFTPDYILHFYVEFDASSNSVKAGSTLLKYSGSGADWSWTPTVHTQKFGSEPIIAGGVGQDFFILTCEYQDISVSKGSTVQFFARSGILYDGKVYNDNVPDEGTVSIVL
jgi:hypothetical protein